jgi:hypothetical protein
LSEDDPERLRHDKLVRQILNQGHAIPLRRLFGLKDYPREVMCLYAEGFSMANYLVANSDRQTYLKFVALGMQSGWDSAVRTYYRHNSVEDLEQAWLAELRRTKGQPPTYLVSNTTRPATAQPAARTMVRLTAPPVQPLEDLGRQPVFRGQAPASDQGEGRFGDTSQRPGYLPDYLPASRSARPEPSKEPVPDGWRPPQGETADPVHVQLGPPEFVPPSSAVDPPRSVSPVGYPR